MGQYVYDSRKTVCYGCKERYIGCHGACEKYIKEKEEMKKLINRYREETRPIGFSKESEYKFHANQFYRT